MLSLSYTFEKLDLKMLLFYLLYQVLGIYEWIIIARVISTWLEDAQGHPIVQLLSKIADPYLNLFRGIIPLIGGTIDLSPLLAFFVLGILRNALIRF